MRRLAPPLMSVFLLLASSSLFAQVAAPGKPQVTVGANLKEMLFEWAPVAGAVNYGLLVKTSDNPSAVYQPVGALTSRTRIAIPIAVHRQLWLRTRYIVEACNSAGCTRSDAVYPRDLMLDTIGYFKASNTDAGDRFGSAIAMSADGNTMAVGAEGEASGSAGVNAGEYDDSMPNAGAVYVFRRNGRKWTKEMYIKAPETAPGAKFGGGSPFNGHTLALSADGNLLLVASPSATVQGRAHAGELNLYRRDSLNRWYPSDNFTAPTIFAEDYYGYDVDLSSDGRTIRVNSLLYASGGQAVGRTHIWYYDGTSWSAAQFASAAYMTCRSARMSAAGSTVMQYCRDTLEGGSFVRTWNRQADGTWRSTNSDLRAPYTEAAPKIAINYAGTALAVDEGNAGVAVYHRTRRDRNWTFNTHILNPGHSQAGPYQSWATALEFDRHGDYLAIGDPLSQATGAGVSPIGCCSTPEEGAVGVWKYSPTSSPQWRFLAHVKATNPGQGDHFGHAIALGGQGWYLAVGAPNEASSIGGIGGNQELDDAPGAGAVYLY